MAEYELEMEVEEVVQDELESLTPADPPPARTTKFVVIAAIMAALGGILFGYDIGIVSGALLQLKQEFDLSCQQQELVVSLLLVGAVMGALIGGFFVDWIGRRWSIILNTVIFIVGAVILAAAPSYNVLIIGRLIVGFAVSLSAIGECIYISEISPANHRGRLVCVNELGITLGILLSYLVNYVFISVPSGWRYMFGLSAIPALVQGIGMVFLPPSPRFLMQKGKDAQARAVLQKLRGTDLIESELGDIRNSLLTEHDYKVWDIWSTVDNMRGRFLIGVGLVFFQQFTGQTNVLYYAPTIFKSLGFGSDAAATLATVGLGLVKVVSTSVCLCFVDRAGRRHFLLVGAGIMTVIIITLGIVAKISLPGEGERPCIAPVTMAIQNSQGNLSLEENAIEALLNDQSITDVLSRNRRDAALLNDQSITDVLSRNRRDAALMDVYRKQALTKIGLSEAQFVNKVSIHNATLNRRRISNGNGNNTRRQLGSYVGLHENVTGPYRLIGSKKQGQFAIPPSGETSYSSTEALSGLDQNRRISKLFSIVDTEIDGSQGRTRIRRGVSQVTPASTVKPYVSPPMVSSIPDTTPIEDSATVQTARANGKLATLSIESPKPGSTLTPTKSGVRNPESAVEQTTIPLIIGKDTYNGSATGPLLVELSIDNGSVMEDVTEGNLTTSNMTGLGVVQGVAFIALMLYVGAYSYGFGPVTWLVLSEIFPAGIRGRASSLATVFNWGTNVVVSLTFLDMMNAIGPSWTFLLYGLICTMSFIFIYFIVPETKNRSLEQISAELKKKSHLTGLSGHCCLQRLGSCCICCHGNGHRRLPPSDSDNDVHGSVDQAMGLNAMDDQPK